MNRRWIGDNPNVPELPQFALIDNLPSYTLHITRMLCIDKSDSEKAGVSVNRDRQTLTRPTRESKQAVDLKMPLWFMNLFPKNGRSRIFMGAILYAMQTLDPREVKMGQIEADRPHCPVLYKFTAFELSVMAAIGRRARMSKYGSIIRTLLFWAFGVPGALEGIISPPTGFKVHPTLMNEMIVRGNTMTLNEYRLVAINGPPIVVIELPEYKMPPWQAKCLKAPDDNNDGSLFYRFLSDGSAV